MLSYARFVLAAGQFCFIQKSIVRCDDRASPNLAIVKEMVNLSSALKREVLDQHLDLACLREPDDLYQLRDRAPIRRSDRALMRQNEEIDWKGAATKTHNRHMAKSSSHLRGHLERRIDANHVEHQAGTLAARHVLEPS
jgi:hypothetical protein